MAIVNIFSRCDLSSAKIGSLYARVSTRERFFDSGITLRTSSAEIFIAFINVNVLKQSYLKNDFDVFMLLS